MAIIAVLAAIAAPRYGAAVGRQRAASGAHLVAIWLNYAASRARQTSQSVTVVFDLPADEFRLVGVPDIDTGSGDQVVRIGEGPFKAQLECVDFGGDAEVVFDGFGVPDTGGKVLVRVVDVRKTVVLDPSMVKASVQ